MRTQDICPCELWDQGQSSPREGRYTGSGECVEPSDAEQWRPHDPELGILWAEIRGRFDQYIESGDTNQAGHVAMERMMQLLRFMGERIEHLDRQLAYIVRDRDANRLLAARYAKDRMTGHSFVLLAGEMDMLYKGRNPELRRAISELSAMGASLTVRPEGVSSDTHTDLLRHELPEF